MIVTTYEYTDKANAKYKYKICVKDNDSNTVFQTNKFSQLYKFYDAYNLNYYDTKTIKKHFNYYGELTATQTIYYTSEGIHNGKIYT